MQSSIYRKAEGQSVRINGFTLVELMLVIVIVSILTVTVGLGMSRQNNSDTVNLFIHKVHVLLNQARNTALDLGVVVEVEVNNEGTQVNALRASQLGIGPPTGSFWINISEENASSGARIQTVRYSAETGQVDSPGSAGLPAKITFNPDGSMVSPDGSIGGVSIYFTDVSDTYHQKIVVFGVTGYSMVLTRW